MKPPHNPSGTCDTGRGVDDTSSPIPAHAAVRIIDCIYFSLRYDPVSRQFLGVDERDDYVELIVPGSPTGTVGDSFLNVHFQERPVDPKALERSSEYWMRASLATNVVVKTRHQTYLFAGTLMAEATTFTYTCKVYDAKAF